MRKEGEKGLWIGKVMCPCLFESVYCSQAAFLGSFCLPSMLQAVARVRAEIHHPGLLSIYTEGNWEVAEMTLQSFSLKWVWSPHPHERGEWRGILGRTPTLLATVGLFEKDSSDFLIYSLHFVKLSTKILRLNYLNSYGFRFSRKILHHIKLNTVKPAAFLLRSRLLLKTLPYPMSAANISLWQSKGSWYTE